MILKVVWCVFKDNWITKIVNWEIKSLKWEIVYSDLMITKWSWSHICCRHRKTTLSVQWRLFGVFKWKVLNSFSRRKIPFVTPCYQFTVLQLKYIRFVIVDELLVMVNQYCSVICIKSEPCLMKNVVTIVSRNGVRHDGKWTEIGIPQK